MTPYLWRLCLLSLAAMVVVQCALALLVRWAQPWITRYATARMIPSAGANLLLLARWAPALVAWLVIALVCVPSYLRWEPPAVRGAGDEEVVGWLCMALAGGAVALYGWPLLRALRELVHSRSRLRQLLRDAKPAGAFCVIEETSVPMAVAGVLHSQVLVSREVLHLLPADQFAVALSHEMAHQRSQDNLKRLLFALAPLAPGHRALRGAWGRLTEWAADDSATEGDGTRAIALASALVRVARIHGCGGASHHGLIAATLISPGAELKERVDRLLRQQRGTGVRKAAGRRGLWAAQVIAATGALVALTSQPSVQAAVHRLLEVLVD